VYAANGLLGVASGADDGRRDDGGAVEGGAIGVRRHFQRYEIQDSTRRSNWKFTINCSRFFLWQIDIWNCMMYLKKGMEVNIFSRVDS
jgi:hypothetical protein